MKKYRYYFKDIDLEIFADCGDEAEAKLAKMGLSDYEGVIELTNLKTGRVSEMLPVKVL